MGVRPRPPGGERAAVLHRPGRDRHPAVGEAELAGDRRGEKPGPCFELLGKKWTALLVRALLEGPRRFTELLDAAPGLSDRVLSQRLKELEGAGIVTRAPYAEVPPRVEYELTRRGRELRAVIEEMERWGRGAPAGGRPPG